MFQLNPFHLTDANLWHFLMLQGMAIIAYLLARERFREQQRNKLRELRQLQEAIHALRNAKAEQVVLPEETGRNDLKEVAGINLKIESILNDVGIFRFGQLANTPVPTLRDILEDHGPLLFSFDPVTWPGQARLAAAGRWAELRVWQDETRRGLHHDLDRLIREGLTKRATTKMNGQTTPTKRIGRTIPRNYTP